MQRVAEGLTSGFPIDLQQSRVILGLNMAEVRKKCSHRVHVYTAAGVFSEEFSQKGMVIKMSEMCRGCSEKPDEACLCILGALFDKLFT